MQLSHCVWPVVACDCPAGHKLHTIAPVAAAYVPGAHSEHAMAPVDEKAPVAQLAQDASAGAPVDAEYNPAGQVKHVAEDKAPVAARYVPAVQLAQVAVPVLEANMPTAQLMHTPAPEAE